MSNVHVSRKLMCTCHLVFTSSAMLNLLQGVGKGVAVERLIATMRSNSRLPDFVLCIGDDSSDEDMFASVDSCVGGTSSPAIAEVFACTVGRKPSKAKFYLDDPDDVIKMLQGLSEKTPVRRPIYPHYRVSSSRCNPYSM